MATRHAFTVDEWQHRDNHVDIEALTDVVLGVADILGPEPDDAEVSSGY
ncbi:MAG TPA: hypothetical protein VGL49_06795 [Acidimicrobiales bacterium]